MPHCLVNLPFTQQLDFFGGERGGELDLQFDFISMQALYLSLARNDPEPLLKALTSRPPIPADTTRRTSSAITTS